MGNVIVYAVLYVLGKWDISYTRNKITDDLHSIFGFRTDYEITSAKNMRNIIKNTKK